MNKKRISLIVLIIGIITLIAGVVFLIVQLNSGPSIADGEYLVSIGEWKLKSGKCEQSKCAENTKCVDENGQSSVVCEGDGVVWNFTEIGKGTLTTNNHVNDYDFVWTLEDGKLKINTEWLYTLNDEFEYTLDQNGNILTLTRGDEEVEFVPLTN